MINGEDIELKIISGTTVEEFISILNNYITKIGKIVDDAL